MPSPRAHAHVHTLRVVKAHSKVMLNVPFRPSRQVSSKSVVLEQLEISFSVCPFSICSHVLHEYSVFCSKKEGEEKQQIINSWFSISIVFHVNGFSQAQGCALHYGAACNNSSEQLAVTLQY